MADAGRRRWSLLAPALRDPDLEAAVWPFDGELGELVARGCVVVAETWPRECTGTWGVVRAHAMVAHPSKRRQADRRRNAPALLAWAAATSTQLAPELATTVESGFGAGPGGEDPSTRWPASSGC